MTFLTGQLAREVPAAVPRGGKQRPLVAEMGPHGLIMRVKGTQESYGPVDWAKVFVLIRSAGGISATLPSEERKRPVKRRRLPPPTPLEPGGAGGAWSGTDFSL